MREDTTPQPKTAAEQPQDHTTRREATQEQRRRESDEKPGFDYTDFASI